MARWHERLVTAGAAAATLVVILTAVALAQSGRDGVPVRPEDPRHQLTQLARRALDDLPLAYQAGDSVVVSAATDPGVSWGRPVPDGRFAGSAFPIGARGLLEYARVATGDAAPDWVRALDSTDRVFADVGPLWFACLRAPQPSTSLPGGCMPALFVAHGRRFYVYAARLGSARFLQRGAPMEMQGFDIIDGSGIGRLLIGGLAGTVGRRVWLTHTDGSRRSAWTSSGLAVAGATVWWTTAGQGVESATVYDATGRVVTRASLAAR